MAIHNLGTTTTTILRSLPPWSAAMAPADVALLGASVSPDKAFASALGGYGPGATGVLATCSLHGTTTLDTLVTSAGAPLSQIRVGDLVLSDNSKIGLETYVAAILSATSVLLSKAAGSGDGVFVAFLRPSGPPALELGTGILTLPGGRGRIALHPGDYVGIDNTGWPIVLSGAAVSYAGTDWNFV